MWWSQSSCPRVGKICIWVLLVGPHTIGPCNLSFCRFNVKTTQNVSVRWRFLSCDTHALDSQGPPSFGEGSLGAWGSNWFFRHRSGPNELVDWNSNIYPRDRYDNPQKWSVLWSLASRVWNTSFYKWWNQQCPIFSVCIHSLPTIITFYNWNIALSHDFWMRTSTTPSSLFERRLD